MQSTATAAQTYFQFVTMAIEPHASSDSTRFAKPAFKPIRLKFKTACCRRRRACVRRGRVCAPCANAASPRSVLLDASDRVHSRRARRRTPKITQKIPAEPIVAPKKTYYASFSKENCATDGSHRAPLFAAMLDRPVSPLSNFLNSEHSHAILKIVFVQPPREHLPAARGTGVQRRRGPRARHRHRDSGRQRRDLVIGLTLNQLIAWRLNRSILR